MKSLRRQLLVAGLLGAVAHAAPAFEITHDTVTYYDFFGAHPRG